MHLLVSDIFVVIFCFDFFVQIWNMRPGTFDIVESHRILWCLVLLLFVFSTINIVTVHSVAQEFLFLNLWSKENERSSVINSLGIVSWHDRRSVLEFLLIIWLGPFNVGV